MSVIEQERVQPQRTAGPPPPPPRKHRTFTVIVAILALVGIVVIALSAIIGGDGKTKSAKPAARTPVSAPAAVGVTLKEFKVLPSSPVARAGTVTFKVRNGGAIKHEFVVLKTTKPAAGLLKGSEADETGNVGEIGSVQPGEAKTLKLKLAAGHYALICNLPGHYTAGQHADFTVKPR